MKAKYETEEKEKTERARIYDIERVIEVESSEYN